MTAPDAPDAPVPLPMPVRWAAGLMWADALLAIPAGIILGEWLGYDFGAYFGGDPTDADVMQQGAGQGVGVMSVGIVIVMGLWLGLSSGILSGSERARSTGVMLFVGATVTLVLGGYVTLGFTGFSWQASGRWLPLTFWGYLVVFAYWAVALAVVILLARRDSLEFFAARTAARKRRAPRASADGPAGKMRTSARLATRRAEVPVIVF